MVYKYGILFLVVTITVGWVAAISSEGQGCIIQEGDSIGEYGACIPFKNCPYAMGQSCRGHLPQMCSDNPEDDTVCCRSQECPPLLAGKVNVPLTGYKAWDYCVSLAELAYPCQYMGDSTTRSDNCPLRTEKENGEVVKIGDYPHLVLLSEVVDVWTSVSFGTLVSEKWVLTSGSVASNPLVEYAKVGGLAAGQGGNPYNIKSRVPHEGFVAGKSFDDIGLLELDRNVAFTKNILPACLHTGNVLPTETLKDIINVVNDFTSMDVEILPEKECSDAFEATIGPGGVRSNTQFCIKQTNDEDLNDGIDGAPLQVYNGGSVVCTQSVLGVYASSEGQVHLTTRVSAYISWIEGKVWPTVSSTSQRKHLHSIIQSIFKK